MLVGKYKKGWAWIKKAHVLIGAIIGVFLAIFWPDPITIRIILSVILSGIAVDVYIHRYPHQKRT